MGTLNATGNCQVILPRGCTLLHSQQQHGNIPVASHPCLGTLRHSDGSHSNRYLAASPCGFNLHFFNLSSDVEYIFMNRLWQDKTDLSSSAVSGTYCVALAGDQMPSEPLSHWQMDDIHSLFAIRINEILQAL